MLSIISCVDLNGAIGYRDKLLDHIPEDLRRFKSLTIGKKCVMGRKTYESIIDINGKPLQDRESIVLTRNKNYVVPNSVKVLSSIDSLLDTDEEIMICGGECVYKQYINLADTIYLTIVHHAFDNADTFFPVISSDYLIHDEEIVKGEKYLMSFITLRKQK